MDLPKPPEDQELRNIIDKLAQFVARNGLEFEQMTKNKQKDNAKFGFLFGGEYFNYYQYKVTTEQAILKQKQKVMDQQALVQHTITQQSIQSAPWQHHSQQQQIQEQIQQSERNLAAQHQALIQQQQVQIDEAIRKAQDIKLQELAKDVDIDLRLCDKIMQPVIDSCTKDAISAGKGWIFSNAISASHCEVISRYLLKSCLKIPRVTALGTSFDLKLHLVYLINDVLHHCVRKNAEDLKNALEDMVVPVFCTTSLGASDDQQQKLSKLLKLWESNNYFEPDVLEQLKHPSASLAAYQTNLITTHATVITPITTAVQNQYVILQKQHQDFVAHISSQLQTPTVLPVAATAAQQSTTSVADTSIAEALNISTNSNLEDPMEVLSPTHSASGSGTASVAGGVSSGASIPFAQAPPSFPPNFSHPPPNFTHPPPGFMPNFQQPPPTFQQPPPGLPVSSFTPAGLPLPDLSKPPPCFPVRLPPPHQAPVIDLNDPNLMPSVPYFELPAGLMAPLVKLEEFEYRPLDPDEIRLPPPAPPSERLLAAVELFYTPPSHERPRNSEGWEQLGLYEFFKAKSQAKKRKEEEGKEIPPPQSPPRRSRSRSQSTERPVITKSKSPPVPKRRYNEHRAKSRSKSRSRSRSKSASPLPYKRSSRSRSRSCSPKRIRSRSISRSRSRSPSPRSQRKRSASRSPTPPSFFGSTYGSTTLDRRLDESNKGHQLMKKMGWTGQGLGATEQGINDPIQAAEVRDRQDQYKGIGINLNDPFETFRKNKGQAFINRMRARAEEKMNH